MHGNPQFLLNTIESDFNLLAAQSVPSMFLVFKLEAAMLGGCYWQL